MKPVWTIVLWGFFAVCLPGEASAQFKSLMRTADKEYDLHAFEQAARNYREALQRRSDDVEALTGLANSYRHLNRMAEAADAFEKASRQDGFNLVNYYYYGHVLKALGRYADAKRAYLRYADVDPTVGRHFAGTCDYAEYQLTNLSNFQVAPVRINSEKSDFGPAFYQDRVIFSSARSSLQPPGEDFSDQPFNNLMQAQSDPQGNLAVPVPLLRDLRRSVTCGPVAIAPNGTLVAYTKNNFRSGVRHIQSSGMKLDLFFAQVDPNGNWGSEIPFTFNRADHSTGFPAFSPDGRTLYFSSDREGGQGGYDIYKTSWTGNGWSNPVNLGAPVNTPGDEISPFIDGETLYFSSNWHPGFGGYDLFKSKFSDAAEAQPENLGVPLNSPNDDYGFIFNSLENKGYLASNRPGGFGSEDIYRVSSTGRTVQVMVRNASDGRPVPFATLDFTTCGRGQYNADAEGKISFQIPPNMNCNIRVLADGYLPTDLSASTLARQGQEPFSVLLTRQGEIYQGQIVDYVTKRPVENVSVEAINQATNNSMQVFTGPGGQYSLALAPNANYILRYSRAGYRDVNRNVQITDASNRDVLGAISLYPTSSGGLVASGTVDPDIGTLPSDGGQAVGGYSIQLAAVRSPALSKFSSLESEGTLYTVEEGNLYKVRLGVYPDKGQANQVLSRVKSKGYKSAFIVKEEGAEPVKSVYGGNTAPPSGGNYFVQLAAYRNPRNFNESMVAGLGKVSESRRGDLTIKYMGPFATLDEARKKLGAAQAVGFSGAYLVERLADGTYQRLRPN